MTRVALGQKPALRVIGLVIASVTQVSICTVRGGPEGGGNNVNHQSYFDPPVKLITRTVGVTEVFVRSPSHINHRVSSKKECRREEEETGKRRLSLNIFHVFK